MTKKDETECVVQSGGVTFAATLQHLEAAVEHLYASDPGVRSLGITRHGHGYGFRVVRNRRVGASQQPVSDFNGVPITVSGASTDLSSLARLPRPDERGIGDAIPERGFQRPLRPGLQIQNCDDRQRRGAADPLLAVGTIGCFVRAADGAVSLLSNNHCVAAENRGARGGDRILQPGSSAYDATQHIATLTDYVELIPSPLAARTHIGRVAFNVVDAGMAKLLAGIPYLQEYLRGRAAPAPDAVASATVGTRVFKVGCATGLTIGTVTDVETVAGPVAYECGDCWFRRSIVIESLDDTPFADHGDSGSAVVTFAGEIIGLLYASDGEQNYVCPIDEVLNSLNCALIGASAD